ncbi:PP2C family protein-serine/threonine phosphatase [Balneolaceae bacterium ANBcel3]|nr:PP2C family protein-serine/threonine phosphatase [Balneolaceae bacterium ANBcel3]
MFNLFKWLLFLAVSGLILFLAIMPRVHPTSAISQLASEQEVIERSEAFIEQAGYSVGNLTPFIVFRESKSLISHQIHHLGKREVYRLIQEGMLHFVPSMYWEVQWTDLNRPGGRGNAFGGIMAPGGELAFKTTHSPDGAVQAFQMEDRSPDEELAREISLSFIFQFEMESSPIQRSDPLSTSSRLPEVRDTDLGKKTTRESLDSLLYGTVWKSKLISVDSLHISENDSLFKSTFYLSPEAPVFGHSIQTTATINSLGNLVSLDSEALLAIEEEKEVESISVFLRIFFLMLILILVIILFIRRVFHRLVDLKTATLYAGIAIFLLIVHLIYICIQMNIFDSIQADFQYLLMLGVIIIFVAFVLSLFVFLFAGLGESMTREFQTDKLTTLSLLRLGYFRKKILGHSIITGVLSVFFLLGVTSVVYVLFPSIYLNSVPENVFFSHSYLSSFWQLISKSIFWTFFIGACIYASFISWLGKLTNSTSFILFAGGLAFALTSSHGIQTEGMVTDLIFWILPGMAVTWVFLKYDLLAFLISLFFFKVIWCLADVMFVAGSPDILLAGSAFSLISVFLITGLWLAKYGYEHKHISEITPAYIHQIARQQKVQRELEIAREVHQTFLPDDLPSPEGLSVHAVCQAAFDVGGDYYDAIQIDDHRLAFVIGDVSGKGIQAAFYMTMVKGIFQSLVKEIPDPIPLLTRMNRLFYDNAQRGSFISLCYGLLDIKKGELRLVRAGHNPAAYIPVNGSAKLLRTHGIAIGLTKDETFEQSLEESVILMSKGDTIVFYTDGVTETINYQQEMFGESRLLESLADNKNKTTEDTIYELLDRLHRFSAGRKAADDMTLLAVRLD